MAPAFVQTSDSGPAMGAQPPTSRATNDRAQRELLSSSPCPSLLHGRAGSRTPSARDAVLPGSGSVMRVMTLCCLSTALWTHRDLTHSQTPSWHRERGRTMARADVPGARVKANVQPIGRPTTGIYARLDADLGRVRGRLVCARSRALREKRTRGKPLRRAAWAQCLLHARGSATRSVTDQPWDPTDPERHGDRSEEDPRHQDQRGGDVSAVQGNDFSIVDARRPVKDPESGRCWSMKIASCRSCVDHRETKGGGGSDQPWHAGSLRGSP